jgi:uncharacterized protein YcbK (DUF882 family)
MMVLRRRDLIIAAAAGLLPVAESHAFANEIGKLGTHVVNRESLWLRRTNGAEINVKYRRDDDYDRAQILMLSWFMRDIADQDKAVWIEPRLFDLLAGVQTAMSQVHGAPLPLLVTSGYRTPAHNSHIESAARNSMHLYGYAADLRVPGYEPRALALAASFYAKGGIGLYDTFTHLDVWKVRFWSGPSSKNIPHAGTSATVPSTQAPKT